MLAKERETGVIEALCLPDVPVLACCLDTTRRGTGNSKSERGQGDNVGSRIKVGVVLYTVSQRPMP